MTETQKLHRKETLKIQRGVSKSALIKALGWIPMALRDGYIGVWACDRCGKIYGCSEQYSEIRNKIDFIIFHGEHKPELPDMCLDCQKYTLPLVFALRDIRELQRDVNKLERAIYECKKRDKNHRRTQANAG